MVWCGGRQGTEDPQNHQDSEDRQEGRGFMSSLGCFACRHPCCFFTNCTKFECPTCHLKVKMCENNCPCNIFTSDETVAAPWAKQNQGRINAEEIENNCPCNIFTSDETVAAPWA